MEKTSKSPKHKSRRRVKFFARRSKSRSKAQANNEDCKPELIEIYLDYPKEAYSRLKVQDVYKQDRIPVKSASHVNSLPR